MFQFDKKRLSIFVKALTRLAEPDHTWVSFQLLSTEEITSLIAISEIQRFREASREVGSSKNRVFQDFQVCFPAPRIDAIERLAKLLEIGFYQAGKSMSIQPFERCFKFNDFAIQRYAPGSRGIGVHRDGLRYKHIVVIVNLSGYSELFACKDRGGSGRIVINDRPGRIVLLSAPRFAGRADMTARPLHGVDNIRGGRLSLGLRVEEN